MTEHKIFTVDIDMRFRDIDAMGHVNNAVYFTYFEYGRLHFFYSESQKDKFPGISFILAHTSCDYVKPLMLSDRPALHMWIQRIGSKSFALHYQLTINSPIKRINPLYMQPENPFRFFLTTGKMFRHPFRINSKHSSRRT